MRGDYLLSVPLECQYGADLHVIHLPTLALETQELLREGRLALLHRGVRCHDAPPLVGHRRNAEGSPQHPRALGRRRADDDEQQQRNKRRRSASKRCHLLSSSIFANASHAARCVARHARYRLLATIRSLMSSKLGSLKVTLRALKRPAK